MTSFALGLVLIAAVLHATWNYWAKRAGGGLPFVYVVSLIIVVGYVPIVAFYLWRWSPPLTPAMAGVILISGVLKTGYSLYLQRAYRHGDFSLIYPLARGTGPLLSTLAAICLLGEKPTPLAFSGGLIIIASIFWLTGGLDWLNRFTAKSPPTNTAGPTATSVSEPPSRATLAVRYGLTCGVFIAAYTLWDKRGVTDWLIPPLLYDAGTALAQLALLTPLALHRRAEVKREWHEHKFNAFVVALIAPVSYVLILTAMKFTPVSYIAPAREVSIAIGAFFGARFLHEAHGRRRILAACAMAVGIIALALG